VSSDNEIPSTPWGQKAKGEKEKSFPLTLDTAMGISAYWNKLNQS
jgi:hypothetical protein